MVEIKGIRFDVQIEHKRIRNLYLRLNDRTIMASAPLWMPDYEVYRFIDKKRDWIYRTYDQMTYRKRATKIYHGGDLFYVFDKPLRLVRNTGKKNVTITDDAVFLTYPDDSDDAIKYLYKQTDRLLLKKAEEYLQLHGDFLKDYGYGLIPELKCQVMSSKWGVCYTRNNRITISSYLIHFPYECLEYIMVHELAHFIVPNHSKRFYSIVSSNMPDYRKAWELLKK